MTIEIRKPTPKQRATQQLITLFKDHAFYIDQCSDSRTDRFKVFSVNRDGTTPIPDEWGGAVSVYRNGTTPFIWNRTKLVALATGTRYNDRTETISLPGYGYNKAGHLKDLIIMIAQQHDLHVDFMN